MHMHVSQRLLNYLLGFLLNEIYLYLTAFYPVHYRVRFLVILIHGTDLGLGLGIERLCPCLTE